MGFSFDLFGFDFLPEVDMYGFWIFSIKDDEDLHRSLFCLHSDMGCIRLELAWMRVI
jgi:hypothetical protein